MKTTLTEFQRSFRQAREAADRGESVYVEAEGQTYVFEKRVAEVNPFVGLEGVFGAVALGQKNGSNREKIRERLAAKNDRRGRRAA